jgi:hypothetical protein
MFAEEQLRELTERKRLLLIEAEMHRNFIALECESLRGRLAPLQTVGRALGGLGTWFPAGGMAGGMTAAGRWTRALRWVPAALTVWRWIRRWRRGV